MGEEAAYLIVQPSGEDSARHDKACTHTALAGNMTNHRHRQGPTWKMRLPISSSSRQEKIMHDTSNHARTSHAQPRRITASANNDNADSTSRMNKSRETMQELHKSAMSAPALARRPIHRLMNSDESHRTRHTARASDDLDQLSDNDKHGRRHASAHKREYKLPPSPLEGSKGCAARNSSLWGSSPVSAGESRRELVWTRQRTISTIESSSL